MLNKPPFDCMLTMIQDNAKGCRLAYIDNGMESQAVQYFDSRVEMKKESKKYAKERGIRLFNRKKTGQIVEIDLN